MTANPPIPRSLAGWSLFGMVLGFGIGLLGAFSWPDQVSILADFLAPVGTLWVNALQMTVIPLVLTQLLSALVRPGQEASIGRLGLWTVGLIFSMLLGAGIVSLLVTPFVLDLFSFPAHFAESILRAGAPDLVIQSMATPGGGISGWTVGLVPPNAFEAAFRGDLIQLLVFTLLLGLAAGHLPEERRSPLAGVFRSLADTMMVMVGWVLWLTPLGVFTVMLRFSLRAGPGVVGVAALYVGLLSAAMVVALLLLYPMTAVWGRVSLKAFARAALPAQIVAAGTQSSLATLPAIIEEGRARLGFSEEITGFVLPLSVSTFKLNFVISQIIKLLFFARVFDVPVALGTGFAFLFGVMMIGVGSPGVPRGGGGFKTLPLHLAAGIPIEAVVLHEAVKAIPDVFYTVLNSTSYLSVATILRGKTAAAPPLPGRTGWFSQSSEIGGGKAG